MVMRDLEQGFRRPSIRFPTQARQCAPRGGGFLIKSVVKCPWVSEPGLGLSRPLAGPLNARVGDLGGFPQAL